MQTDTLLCCGCTTVRLVHRQALWNSIRANEHIAARKGIELTAYGMSDSSGYPPCGVPLRSDSSVDMHAAMGNSTGIVRNIFFYIICTSIAL